MTISGRSFSKPFYILIAIIAIAILLRLGLPYGIKTYINQQLSTMPTYQGQVEEVSLSLLAGNITVNTIHLYKRDRSQVITLPMLRVHLLGTALLQGKILLQFDLQRPQIVIYAPSKTSRSTSSFQVLWQQTLSGFRIMKAEQIKIQQGSITYIDQSAHPYQLAVTNIDLLMDHLQATPNSKTSLPACLKLTATTSGKGQLAAEARFNPRLSSPTFQAKLSLEQLELKGINPFLAAVSGLTVDQGKFSFYTEATAKNGGIQGYFKPFFAQVEIKIPAEQQTWFKQAYRAMVQGINKLLQNPDTNKTAAKIPFSGKFNDPKFSLWTTFLSALKNAFVEVIPPGIEHSLDKIP